MNLYTETWGRDICELINYDSVDLFLNTIKIKEGGCLYRLNNRIFYTKDEVNCEEYEILLKLKKNEDYFEIIPNKYETDENGNISSLNSSWFLLKKFKLSDKYNKYKIHTGDIIKIGRIITRIKEIKYSNKKNNKNYSINTNTEKSETNSINKSKISNQITLKDIGDFTSEKEVASNKGHKILSLANQRNATDPNLGDRIQVLALNKNNKENKISNNNIDLLNNVNIIKINTTKIKKQNAVCRICYGEEEDEKENPMVQPCQCSGSLKYIHLLCLKHWIMTRSCSKVDDNEYCTVFLFKETECEICKSKLPDLINHKGKLYSLLDFTDDYKDYLALETLTLDEENNKFLYIISLDKKSEIRVGRGISSDVLLSDVSVSRVHCLFSIEGKNIFLQDNNSKFGTLILVQTPSIKIAENLPLCIQVGRTFFNINVEQDKSIFSCCGVQDNPNVFYHFNQNEKQVKLKRVVTVKTDNINNNSEEEEDDKEKEIITDNKEKEKDDNEIKIQESNDDNSIKIVIEDE